jgi:formamidopyrimidine-DNA glycosylase
MPELPEVETTRRGIAPHVEGLTLTGAVVRQPQLRWPVPPGLDHLVQGRRVARVGRRAKYLLLGLDPAGGLVLHLGMSGSLRVLPADTPPHPHDHVDLLLEDGAALRLRDPRRFGAVLATDGPPEDHERLAGLGPEPLGPDLEGAYLQRRARGRQLAVKAFLMDAGVVAGIGNIYASEALFYAGIHPQRPAGQLGEADWDRVVRGLRHVLGAAVEAGGTSLRDFTRADGAPGYFRQALAVYGREGEPCPHCGTAVRLQRIGQRSSYFCPACQGEAGY